jgi:type III pantothenate kinase
MFIAIDIGNSNTVFGVYKKRKLIADWRLTSVHQWMKDEIWKQLLQFLTESGIDVKKIDGIGISSVVPDLTDVYKAMTQKYFHREPLIVSAALDLGIKIHYDNPKSIGADRLCNVVAGYSKYGGPLIIIDFGTATTYNIVASNGDYLGGVIAPGIETSAVDLYKRAAKLPKVKLHLPKTVIGTDTVTSMQNGILWGAIDAMIGMVNRIQEELKQRESKKVVVIATGGFSKFIAKHTHVIQHVESSLVLDGILLIFERSIKHIKVRK